MDLVLGIFGLVFIIFRVVIGAALFLLRAHVAFARNLFSKGDDAGDALARPQTKRQ